MQTMEFLLKHTFTSISCFCCIYVCMRACVFMKFIDHASICGKIILLVWQKLEIEMSPKPVCACACVCVSVASCTCQSQWVLTILVTSIVVMNIQHTLPEMAVTANKFCAHIYLDVKDLNKHARPQRQTTYKLTYWTWSLRTFFHANQNKWKKGMHNKYLFSSINSAPIHTKTAWEGNRPTIMQKLALGRIFLLLFFFLSFSHKHHLKPFTAPMHHFLCCI